MPKAWDWIVSKKRNLTKYEEAKKEFSKILGKPLIMIPLELPDELTDQKEKFLALERDKEFIKIMETTCAEYLKKKKTSSMSTSK